jgi:hypothetical protein
MKTMTDQLGPFQDFWESWNEAEDQIQKKNFEHFQRAVAIQFEEMRVHLENNDRRAAACEVADVISIALNTMRWLRYQPEEIAEIVRDRAVTRMRGRTNEILEKYQRKYGI